MNSKGAVILLLFILCVTPSAWAYLDPGSGSYILQMLIAGFLGGLYAIKLYWGKIVRFFTGRTASEEDSLEEVDDE